MTEAHMRRALSLARRAQGTTSPNPPVGAVLVRDDRIVAEGWTKPAGQAHAEIVALRQAGDAAIGSTLYVTLEPCSHWGRTPPCADALVEAGVARVHVAALDPNPRVNGMGVRHLQHHGIEVTIGACAPEARELIEAHAKYITTGCPFVTLLVRAPEQLRAEQERGTDAILSDLPLPSSPPPAEWTGIRPPLRILLDPAGRRPVPSGGRIILVTAVPPREKEQILPGDNRILHLPADGDGIDFPALLAELGRHNITSCLVTGSEQLAQELLARGVVDKIVGSGEIDVPRGFSPGRESHDPVPHVVLYRQTAHLEVTARSSRPGTGK